MNQQEHDDCECVSREDVYDAHIAPLVAEILEICKSSGMPVVIAVGIASDDNPELMVTSASFGGDASPNDGIVIAYHVLTNDTSPLLEAATRRKES